MALMHNMKIARLEELTGYNFNDEQHARESLQAAGSPFAPTSDGNKRLAMKGDAILRFLIIEDLYKANHTRGIPIHDIERWNNEGVTGSMQTTISRVVANNNLDRVGRDLGLAHIINRAPSSPANVVSPTTMSATMEAILGAVWDDSTGDLSAIRLVAQNLGLWPEV